VLSTAALLLVVSLGAWAEEKPGITDVGDVPWGGPEAQPKVIYGTDDRIDVGAETNPTRIALAKSVCALVDASDLTAQGNGNFQLSLYSYRYNGDPGCVNEPFRNQPVAAFCTGFMVGPDLIATAGHCLSSSNLSASRFVFGFTATASGTPTSTFSANQVYTPIAVVGRRLENGFDYCILRVDRAITAPGAVSLPIRRSGTIPLGTQVGVIGHPAGLPMKIAFGANTVVRSNSEPAYFVANLDTYGGNSGSPVFNQATGVVEGILVRGELDYLDTGSCFVSNTVSNTGGRGEDVAKSTTFSQHIPEIAGSRGLLELDRELVRCGGVVNVALDDADLMGQASTVVSISVGGDTENLVLSATALGLSNFTGSFTVQSGPATPGNGIVEANSGSVISVTYLDEDNGQGVSETLSRTVSVDCNAPMITGVAATSPTSAGVVINFTTNESAIPLVFHGPACNALGFQASGPAGLSHSIAISGLAPNTEYRFRVQATDLAGNIAQADNGGLCFSFRTTERLDYFTQQFFTGATALANRSITFTPVSTSSGYAACIESITAFPTSPDGGTPLTLADDGSAMVQVSGNQHVRLYGGIYQTLYVNSNGNVTFLAPDDLYAETLPLHFAAPRVSLLFDDFSPNLRGSVSYRQLSDRIAITYLDVPFYQQGTLSPTNKNSFQLEMFFDGVIRISYLNLVSGDGIVGLSRGTGLPSDFVATEFIGLSVCVVGDTDEDGLLDEWELRAGLDPEDATGDNGADGDPDLDGLSNAEEQEYGTHPKRPDSDFDGVSDADEIQAGTDPTGSGGYHDTDTDRDYLISLSELLRCVQLYNAGIFHCAPGTEDGYDLFGGDMSCRRHHADYTQPAWKIDLSELLRVVQLFNSKPGYTRDVYSEDSFGL